MTDKIRQAIMVVTAKSPSLEQLERYLPANYIARFDSWDVEDVEATGAYVPSAFADGLTRVPVIVIEGIDQAGWTLDGYVIPRLASGGIMAREVTS